MGAKNRRQKDKCRSKITYKDMTKANNAAIALSRKGDDPVKLWSYRCSICGGIHIGHASTKHRQAARQRRAARGER